MYLCFCTLCTFYTDADTVACGALASIYISSKEVCRRILFRSCGVQIAENPVQVLNRFGSSSVLDLGESKAALAAAAELEAALVEHVYSSPQTALRHLQAAAYALGMHTIVEGQRAELQCSDFVCFVA